MACLPRYVQILRALHEVAADDIRNPTPTQPDRYYQWMISCRDRPSKDSVQKQLRPFLPPHVDFDAAQLVSYMEEEQGTRWGLFAGPDSEDIRRSMRSLIKDWVRADSDNPDGNASNFVEVWGDADQYIFHFAVLCSPQMRSMVAAMVSDSLETFREIFTLEPHHALNAAGQPCVHIAAAMGRLDIVKHLISLDPEVVNIKFGEKAETVLHCAVRSYRTDVTRFLVREVSGVDQSIKDIQDRTPFHLAVTMNHNDARLLYGAMSPKEKSAVNAGGLLHDEIANMTHADIQWTFEITELIIGDRDFDWSTQRRNPYFAALYKHLEMCDWLARFSSTEGIPGRVVANRATVRDASIRMLHKLNDSLVPMRYYNEHGSTVILSLVEHVPVEVFQAIFESLPERSQQNGEILICSSIDLDGDTALELAARRGPEFRRIAEAWRDHDLAPEVLQHFINHKDYRQAAEILFVQGRFKEALTYLSKVERSNWTMCLQARACLALRQYRNAYCALDGADDNSSILRLKSCIASGLNQSVRAMELNRAAYVKEEEMERSYEKAVLQEELCEEALSASVLPPELRKEIGKQMAFGDKRQIGSRILQ